MSLDLQIKRVDVLPDQGKEPRTIDGQRRGELSRNGQSSKTTDMQETREDRFVVHQRWTRSTNGSETRHVAVFALPAATHVEIRTWLEGRGISEIPEELFIQPSDEELISMAQSGSLPEEYGFWEEIYLGGTTNPEGYDPMVTETMAVTPWYKDEYGIEICRGVFRK